RELGRKHLDGDLGAGRDLTREIHVRHPALAELLHHLIARVEDLPRKGGGAVEAQPAARRAGRADGGVAAGGRRRRGGLRLRLDEHVAVARAEPCGFGVDRPALGTAALAHCRTKLRPSFFARLRAWSACATKLSAPVNRSSGNAPRPIGTEWVMGSSPGSVYARIQ